MRYLHCMFKRSFRARLFLAFAVLLVLITWVNFSSYSSIWGLRLGVNSTLETKDIILTTQDIMSNLTAAEALQTDFVQSRDSIYYFQFIRKKVDIKQDFSQIVKVINQDKNRLARVDSFQSLVNQKLTIIERRFLENNIEIIGKIAKREDLSNAEIRILAEGVIEAEERLLNNRKTELEVLAKQTINGIYASSALIGVFLLIILFIILSSFKTQKDAETKLELINKDLLKVSDENEQKNWVLTGSTRLNEQLRGAKSLDDLCFDILQCLAEYSEAVVGSFYLYDDDTKHLIFSAGYCVEDEGIKKIIPVGEGLVGNAAKTLRPMFLSNLPTDHIKLSSSIMELKPKEVAVIPLAYNKIPVGVMELGYANPISLKVHDFLGDIAENISVTIQATKSRERLRELFNERQLQAEELEAQREELEATNAELMKQTQQLQVNEEELKMQQEELKFANAELEEKANLLEEKNNAIEEAGRSLVQKAEELEIANKYKSEFLANMSHELRTPLNSILILAGLLSENKKEHMDSDEVRYASVILKAGKDLLTLINDILDLSKIEAGKLSLTFEKIAVDEIEESMYHMFKETAEKKAIQFQITKETNLSKYIESDKVRLEQIIRNLLSNAFKFTPQEGKVGLNFSTEDSFLAVTVTDSGIGIAKDKQQKIFEAFQQEDGATNRKYGGTGLGLSICKELVGLLVGKISVQSETGKGSTFKIVVPVKAPEGETLEVFETDEKTKVVTNAKRKIVVIEDDAIFAKILVNEVENNGLSAVWASNGEDGLKLINEHKPEAVLLDISLPGMDGWSVLKQIKANSETAEIPVHIVSASDPGEKPELKGAISFLQKPISKEALQSVFLELPKNKENINRVLVVEDHSVQSEYLKTILNQPNCLIEQAEDVKKAKELLDQNKYACLILDMNLPDGTGFDVLEHLQKNDKIGETKILIHTAEDLSISDLNRLDSLSASTILKNEKSGDRILNEVNLFMKNLKEGKKAVVSKAILKPESSLKNDMSFLENKKVLLVDDDMRNIYALSSILTAHKAKVSFANNGVEAINLVKSEGDFDVILMDIMMPEMDGYEATRQIRKMDGWETVPIIAATAKAMKEDREKCMAAGASDYISKPIDMKLLGQLLSKWLR